MICTSQHACRHSTSSIPPFTLHVPALYLSLLSSPYLSLSYVHFCLVEEKAKRFRASRSHPPKAKPVSPGLSGDVYCALLNRLASYGPLPALYILNGHIEHTRARLDPQGGCDRGRQRGVGSKRGSVNLPIMFFLLQFFGPLWGVSDFRTLQGVSTPHNPTPVPMYET